MDTPVIELSGVKKSFGPVDVLKGVDLKAYAGKVTALVGDNGAGKSTLIKGLSGVQPYDEGVVKFNGEAVNIHDPRQAGAIGIEVGRHVLVRRGGGHGFVEVDFEGVQHIAEGDGRLDVGGQDASAGRRLVDRQRQHRQRLKARKGVAPRGLGDRLYLG